MYLEIQNVLNDLTEHQRNCSAQTHDFIDGLQALSIQWTDSAGKRFSQINATDSVEVSEKFVFETARCLPLVTEFVNQSIVISELAAQQEKNHDLILKGYEECENVRRLTMQLHMDANNAHANIRDHQQEVKSILNSLAN